MGPTNFIFLNATGTPGLSPGAAKQMRSHVTKTNFAKRRQRIRQSADTDTAETRAHERTANQQTSVLKRRNIVTNTDNVPILPLGMQPTDRYNYGQFLSKLWSLVFLDGGEYPTTPDEAAWISLLISEPALVESSMAVGARYWSPNGFCQQLSEIHSFKAVHIILQRIKSGSAHADAVIGAVLTMAFGERLMHNDVTWGIHIDGVTRIIRERRSQGFDQLPQWFDNLLVLDVINNVLGFPRFYHKKIAEEASAFRNHPLSDIKVISESLKQLLDSIEYCRSDHLGPRFMTEDIGSFRDKLLCQTQALRVDHNPFIQATTRSFELIIHLSCSYPSTVNLSPIACELKQALCQLRLQLRPCSYMDLTSCQLMIGAIAAERGSQTREWFVATLKSAVVALQRRGWDDPLAILKKGFVSRSCLMTYFRCLWNELGP